MSSTPNLFAYATSELSQDAWLCWLVAHIDHDDRPGVRDAARDLVAQLWCRAHPDRPVVGRDVRGLSGGDPQRQHEHIDVLFEVGVGDRRVAFVVEDKTETSHHSQQLARYRDLITREKPGVDVVPVYFKTGYHFELDTSASADGYVVITLDDLVSILAPHQARVNSDIFLDFVHHKVELQRERADALEALASPGGYAKLAYDYVQHAFLGRLVDAAAAAGDKRELHHGRNLDGTPHAHWTFASTAHALPGGIGESLYHRVDARLDGTERRFYLSTRQYARVKGSEEARRAKLERLRAYRRAFAAAVASAGTGLRFARPFGDNRGANDSEIGVLFLHDGQTTADVLSAFGKVHRLFVDALPALGLAP